MSRLKIIEHKTDHVLPLWKSGSQARDRQKYVALINITSSIYMLTKNWNYSTIKTFCILNTLPSI